MKAILFDFDGTLVDTQTLYNIAVSRVLSDYNKKYTVEYCSHFFEGRCWHDAFDGIAHEEGFDKDAIFNRGLDLAKEMISKQAKPTAGTLDALEDLKSKGAKMAICSNSHSQEILSILKQTRMEEFFDEDCILGRDSVQQGKPASDIYLLGLKVLGVGPRQAIAVEDSLNGAKASLDANIETVIFTGSTSFNGMNFFEATFQKDLLNFHNMKNFAEYVIRAK